MPKDKIQFLIDIDETGSPVIRHVGGEIEQLDTRVARSGKSFQSARMRWLAYTAALTAGIYVISKVMRTISGLVDAYGVQEAAEWDLAVAMKNTGDLSERNIEILKDYASHLQRLTVYGDEVTLSVMANLKAYGMNIQELKQATVATMDLATAKKIDLRTASELVGKAFVGETGTLSRYGIVLDENIPKTEKFAAVLQLINERFGGAAQAQISTYQGLVKQLANAWGDLREALGELLLPRLRATVVAITNIIYRMNDWAKTNQTTIQQIVSRDFASLIDGLHLVSIAIQVLIHVWLGWRQIVNLVTSVILEAFARIIKTTTWLVEMLNFQNVFDSWIEALKNVSGTTREWADIYYEDAEALIDKQYEIIETFKNLHQAIEMIGEEAERQSPKLTKLLDDMRTAPTEVPTAPGAPPGEDWWGERMFERIGALHDLKMSCWEEELIKIGELIDAYGMLTMQSEAGIKTDELWTNVIYGLAGSIQTAIQGYDSLGDAVKNYISDALSAIASEATIMAIYSAAWGIISLAKKDYSAATEYFVAAVKWAAVAVAAGAAASALGGGGGSSPSTYGGGYQGGYRGMEREGEPEEYAQKWEIHMHGDVITYENWAENTLVPILKKIAKRDTQISITYD